MSVFTAVLLGLAAAFLQSTPLVGGQFNQLSMKPLWQTFWIGLIIGDMAGAMEIGVVLQAMYLGVMTVGGVSSMPTINMCIWFIIPVCVATNQGPDMAMVLAAAFGSAETVVKTLLQQLKLINLHAADRALEKGNVRGTILCHLSGYMWQILFYVPIITICNLIGTEAVLAVAAMMPAWLTSILGIFVKFCPLIGFSMLLSGLISNEIQWVFVLLGFTLLKVLGMSILQITIVAAVIAYILFVCTKKEVA